MSYFSNSIPRPEPDMDDAAFWAHCAQRRLRFQACGACGTPRHPPQPICPQCRSLDQRWIGVSGVARIYTYTVIHHASHEAVESRLPYVVAVVEFPDLPGVRLISNVTDVEPAEVHIGMPLMLWWDEIGDSMFIPRFRPLSAAAV